MRLHQWDHWRVPIPWLTAALIYLVNKTSLIVHVKKLAKYINYSTRPY